MRDLRAFLRQYSGFLIGILKYALLWFITIEIYCEMPHLWNCPLRVKNFNGSQIVYCWSSTLFRPDKYFVDVSYANMCRLSSDPQNRTSDQGLHSLLTGIYAKYSNSERLSLLPAGCHQEPFAGDSRPFITTSIVKTFTSNPQNINGRVKEGLMIIWVTG